MRIFELKKMGIKCTGEGKSGMTKQEEVEMQGFIEAGRSYAFRRNYDSTEKIPCQNLVMIGRLLKEFPEIENISQGTAVLNDLLTHPETLNDGTTFEEIMEALGSVQKDGRNREAWRDTNPAIQTLADETRHNARVFGRVSRT